MEAGSWIDKGDINPWQGVPDLSGYGDVNHLIFGLGPDKPPTSAIMKQEFQRSIIYQMSPLEVPTYLYASTNVRFRCSDVEPITIIRAGFEFIILGCGHVISGLWSGHVWYRKQMIDTMIELDLYGDNLQDSTLAAMLLKPGPVMALMTAKFPEEGMDRVRRVYIKTAQDRVVKPEQQDAMIARWPPSEVFMLDSDHSPFFSAPFLLLGLLVKVAASCGWMNNIWFLDSGRTKSASSLSQSDLFWNYYCSWITITKCNDERSLNYYPW